jgi:predicted SAM-dependent methyltransferase
LHKTISSSRRLSRENNNEHFLEHLHPNEILDLMNEFTEFWKGKGVLKIGNPDHHNPKDKPCLLK